MIFTLTPALSLRERGIIGLRRGIVSLIFGVLPRPSLCRSFAASSWCQGVQLGASPSMMEVTLWMMRLPLSVCSMTCLLERLCEVGVGGLVLWLGVVLLQSYVRIIRTDVRVVKGDVAVSYQRSAVRTGNDMDGQAFGKLRTGWVGRDFTLTQPSP